MMRGLPNAAARNLQGMIDTLRDSVGFWRSASAVLATLSAALLVAAIIKRDPPDFSNLPIIAVIRDAKQRPAWGIRLAGAAHQIAVDSLRGEPVPADRAYQLWLLFPDSVKPHQLGLMPQSGRKRIAVSPADSRRLAGAGELVVTLEPPGGSPAPVPSGPVIFRGALEGRD
jgi:anti-sigma-K factor RskA